MAPVAGGAVDHTAFDTELRPTGAAMFTHPTAVVVMIHHSLADARLGFTDAGADFGHHPTRLVPGDHRLAIVAQP